jgi:hypothetical protein
MVEMELIYVCREKAVRSLDPDGYVPVTCYLTVSCWKEADNCFLLSRAGRVYKVSRNALAEAESLGSVSRGPGPFLTGEGRRALTARD